MKKILIITEKDYDDSEVLYPYFRMIEEGYLVDVASNIKDEVFGKYHFKITANLTFDKINADNYDALFLPGGKAPEKLRLINNVLKITQQFMEDGKPIAAICHGQQILISANVLKGFRATCYPGIRDDLKNAGAEYVDDKVVVCKNLVTSRRPNDLPYFMQEFLKLL